MNLWGIKLKKNEKSNLKHFNTLVVWYFKTHKNKEENIEYWYNLINNLLFSYSYIELENMIDSLNAIMKDYNYNCFYMYDALSNKYNLITIK